MKPSYIAPIVITVVIVGYLIAFGMFILPLPGLPLLVKMIAVVVPLAVSGCAIAVLIQRIREIKGGEEDAARKY